MKSLKSVISELSQTPYTELEVWREVKNKVLFPKIDQMAKDKANYAAYLENQNPDLTELTDKEAGKILKNQNRVAADVYALLAVKQYVDLLFSAVNECLQEVLKEWMEEREVQKRVAYKLYEEAVFWRDSYLRNIENEKSTIDLYSKMIFDLMDKNRELQKQLAHDNS